METLKCKLLEYAILFSGKTLWGLDCDLEELQIELLKVYKYLFLKESLVTPNECEIIPIELQQKIDKYIKNLNRRRSSFCVNC